MNPHGYLVAGILFALSGGILWWKQEKHRKLISIWVILSILLILFGAFNILLGINKYLNLFRKWDDVKPKVDVIKWWDWFFILGLIFIGSVSYTIAAYYHLKLENWSFFMAFAIAVPLILIEYQFSIRGNYAAKHVLNLNAVQITLITMTFYFVNSWVLNKILFNRPVVWWRELLAFLCIIMAFILSTNNREH